MKKLLYVLILGIIISSSLQLITARGDFEKTGTITENGDEVWDDGEIEIYDITIFEGEKLDISFESEGNLELMMCDCRYYNDVEDILTEFATSQDISYIDGVYFWIDSYSITTKIFDPHNRFSAQIAVFTYNSSNPSTMDYTITTNLPLGDRFEYSDTIDADEDPVIAEDEYAYYKFELEDETLLLDIIGTKKMAVVLCDCNNITEIQSYVNTPRNSSDITFYVSEGIFSLDYTATGREDVSLFIFSIDFEKSGVFVPSTFSYKIHSNIAQGDRIEDITSSTSIEETNDGPLDFNALNFAMIMTSLMFIYFRKGKALRSK